MKIKSAEILSFGKFKNRTLVFKDGLNIISGNNESGKSTVINFIYAMFYGFGDNRGKGLSMREKYTPWDGGECEGRLNLISDDGEPVTIYRKAGSVKKYDILKVYNSDTAQELNLDPESIVGVNSDTFLRTLCIKQLSSSFEGSSSEIATRLANISTGGDESASYEKAVKIIESARKEIRPLRGNGGSLSAVNTEISALERAKLQQQSEHSTLESCCTELPFAENALKKAEEEYEKALRKNYDASIANIRGRISEKEAYIAKTEKKHSVKLPYTLSAAIFLLLSIVLYVTSTVLWYIPFITALAIIIFSFSAKTSTRNISETEPLDNLHKELALLEKEKAAHENSLSSLRNNVVSARKNLEALNIQISSIKSRIDYTDVSALPSLYEKRNTLEKNHSVLTLVYESLASAYSKMQKNFTPTVNKKASEYFRILTENKYGKVFCDEDFNLRIEAGAPRESEFFSGGTVDQLYLSLRLALVDMLFRESGIFIMLDQPFLQYDNLRTEKAVRLLDSLPESRQILLFTSDKKDFYDNKDIEILT